MWLQLYAVGMAKIFQTTLAFPETWMSIERNLSVYPLGVNLDCASTGTLAYTDWLLRNFALSWCVPMCLMRWTHWMATEACVCGMNTVVLLFPDHIFVQTRLFARVTEAFTALSVNTLVSYLPNIRTPNRNHWNTKTCLNWAVTKDFVPFKYCCDVTLLSWVWIITWESTLYCWFVFTNQYCWFVFTNQ